MRKSTGQVVQHGYNLKSRDPNRHKGHRHYHWFDPDGKKFSSYSSTYDLYKQDKYFDRYGKKCSSKDPGHHIGEDGKPWVRDK